MGGLQPQLAAQAGGAVGQVAQPAAPAAVRDADAVIADPDGEEPRLIDVHDDVHRCRAGVPGGVRQRLP